MRTFQPIWLSIAIVLLLLINLSDISTISSFVLWEFRLPRVLGALFSGMGLALAGLMMQTLFRNPLAGPFLIGVTPGAGLGMAVYILLGGFLPVSVSQLGASVSAMIGAMLILGLQLVLNKGFGSPVRMLLTGMVLGFIASALIQLMQQFSNLQALQQFTFWGMGTFENITWPEPLYILIPIVILSFIVWRNRNVLDTYLLGDIYVKSDGIPLLRVRRMLVLGGAILAGYITSFCGPIGFVGLIGPHISKQLSQTESHKKIIFPTLLWGGLLSLGADTLAHRAIDGVVLQVNPIAAIIGAPILIWSLMKRPSSID